jgi:hypothetical protein
MHKKLLLIIIIFLVVITSYSLVSQNSNNAVTLNDLHIFTLEPLKQALDGKTITLKNMLAIQDWNHPIAPLQINKIHQTGLSHVLVFKDIKPLPDTHVITILSTGYGNRVKRWLRGIPSDKGSIVTAYNDYKHDTIFSPAIVSDYLHDRAHFTFGQKTEVESLELIYAKTHKENPNARIVITGNCLGARAALYFSAQNPANLAALLIQSPFISMPQLVTDISKSYVSWFPGSQPIIKWLFSNWFYNYKPENDTLLSAAVELPKQLPIFVAHLFNDTHVNNRSMFELVKILRDSGHHDLYFFVLHSPTKKVIHGRLQETKSYVQALNAFYEKHNLPHDPMLAKQGKQLLQDAYHNTHAASVNDWKVVNY